MRRLIAAVVVLGIAALIVLYLLWLGGGAGKAQTIIVEEGANLSRLCPGLARKDLVPGNCQT